MKSKLRSILIKIISFVFYYSGLIRVLRFFGRQNTKILLYHSINEEESSFIKGTDVMVSPSIFAKHLKYLKNHYKVISLQDLVEFLKRGKILPRSVVITFDDGFADTYVFAYPYLKQFIIPATIFLVTDSVDNKKPIWIQELCYFINTFGVDKVIEIIGTYCRNSKINHLVIDISNNNLYQQVEKYFKYSIDKDHREKILSKLYKEFNISHKENFSENQVFLNWNQIKEMCKGGICFGNHGESHTPFSSLSPVEQEKEIFNSKNEINQNLEQEFLPFSYPFGQTKDFTSTTKKYIKNAKHDCILTAMPIINEAKTSYYELGRIVIDNLPIHRFALELERGSIKHLLSKLVSYKEIF